MIVRSTATLMAVLWLIKLLEGGFSAARQADRLDPLPWAGDTATRVASSMGNAIFVAAWLIMAVPYTLYRFFIGTSQMLAARSGDYGETASDDGRRRVVRRAAYSGPDYG